MSDNLQLTDDIFPSLSSEDFGDLMPFAHVDFTANDAMTGGAAPSNFGSVEGIGPREPYRAGRQESQVISPGTFVPPSLEDLLGPGGGASLVFGQNAYEHGDFNIPGFQGPTMGPQAPFGRPSTSMASLQQLSAAAVLQYPPVTAHQHPPMMMSGALGGQQSETKRSRSTLSRPHDSVPTLTNGTSLHPQPYEAPYGIDPGYFNTSGDTTPENPIITPALPHNAALPPNAALPTVAVPTTSTGPQNYALNDDGEPSTKRRRVPIPRQSPTAAVPSSSRTSSSTPAATVVQRTGPMSADITLRAPKKPGRPPIEGAADQGERRREQNRNAQRKFRDSRVVKMNGVQTELATRNQEIQELQAERLQERAMFNEERAEWKRQMARLVEENRRLREKCGEGDYEEEEDARPKKRRV